MAENGNVTLTLGSFLQQAGVVSGKNVTIDVGDDGVSNLGLTMAENDLNVTTTGMIHNQGYRYIVAGADDGLDLFMPYTGDNWGTMSGGTITITAQDLYNHNVIHSGNTLKIETDTVLDNGGGTLHAGGNMTLAVGADLFNRNHGYNPLTGADQVFTVAGTIESETGIYGDVVGTTWNNGGLIAAPIVHIEGGIISNVPESVLALDKPTIDPLTGQPVAGSATVPGQTFTPVNATLIDLAWLSLPERDVSGLLNLDLAGKTPYLVGSGRYDPNSFGPEYLINQLSSIAKPSLRFLFDPLAEATALQQASLIQTGSKFFQPEFTTLEEQQKGLYQNTIAFANTVKGLEFGKALTDQQRAKLTEPIIWYEQRTIQGQKVLAPVVYLAQLTPDTMQGGRIIGDDVTLIASLIDNRGGTIEGKQQLIADATNIINQRLKQGNALTGGMITGGNVYLSAADKLKNIGGEINATGALVVDAKKLVNKALTGADGTVLAQSTLHGDTVLLNTRESLLNRGGSITNSTSLTLIAPDIINENIYDAQGNIVQKGILHGNNVTLIADNVIRNDRASIIADGDLVTQSKVFNNKQGTVDVAGNANITADTRFRNTGAIGIGGNLLVAAGEISNDTLTRTVTEVKDENAGLYPYYAKKPFPITTMTRQVVDSVGSITTGGAMTMIASGNLTNRGMLEAGGDIYLQGKNVTNEKPVLETKTVMETAGSFFYNKNQPQSKPGTRVETSQHVADGGRIISKQGDITIVADETMTNRGGINAKHGLVMVQAKDIFNEATVGTRTLTTTGSERYSNSVIEGRLTDSFQQTALGGGNIQGDGVQLIADNKVVNRGNINGRDGDVILQGRIVKNEAQQLINSTARAYLMPSPKGLYQENAIATTISGTGGTIQGNNVTLDGSERTINRGKIDADGALVLQGKDVINEATAATDTRQRGYVSEYEQHLLTRSGQLAGESIALTADRDIANHSGRLEAGSGGITVTAGRDIVMDTVPLYGHTEGKRGAVTNDTLKQPVSLLKSEGDVTVLAGNDMTLLGTRIKAGGDAIVHAENTLIAGAPTKMETYHSKSGKFTVDIQKITPQQTEITAGGNASVTSGGDMILAGTKIKAEDGTATVDAGGQLALLSVESHESKSIQKHSSNIVWQKQEGNGFNSTTQVMNTIEGGAGTNVTAAHGIIADIKVKEGESIEQSIKTLSKQPGLEYLADLQNRNDIKWNAVNDAYKDWHYKQQGLSGAGAAIIAIAVTIATAGAGASMAGMVAAGSQAAGGAAIGATAGGATVVSGATVAATNAAFSTLVSQAAVSLVNNQGNIGRTLKDLGSMDTVKNIAMAAVTAGATQGIGESLNYAAPIEPGNSMFTSQGGLNIMDQPSSQLNYSQLTQKVLVNTSVNSIAKTAIYGGDLGQNFVDSLKTQTVYAAGAKVAFEIGGLYYSGEVNEVTHLLLHGALGCAIGAGTSGNCAAGAIGGAVGEGVAGATGSALTGQYAALAAALASGQDAEGIYTANGVVVNALQNNFLTLAARQAALPPPALPGGGANPNAPDIEKISQSLSYKMGLLKDDIANFLEDASDWWSGDNVESFPAEPGKPTILSTPISDEKGWVESFPVADYEYQVEGFDIFDVNTWLTNGGFDIHEGANDPTIFYNTRPDTVEKIGNNYPKNSKYAGQTYPVSDLPVDLQVKYPDSVKFDEKGFPVFSPYAIATVKVEGLRGNHTTDFTAANKAAGIAGSRAPKGYTWHHVEDGKTMQLIPTDLHDAVRHTGGCSVIKNGGC